MTDPRMSADKILPPDATPATKEEHLKHLPALQCVRLSNSLLHRNLLTLSTCSEFPLNCEICDPVEDAVVERSSSVSVKGYAVGSKGAPSCSLALDGPC